MTRALALLLVGCSGGGSKDTGPTNTIDPTDPTYVSDGDSDGFDEDDGDCDDNNFTIYPGAPDEPYDGVDSDCAGDSDYDADGDGYDSDLYGGDDCDDADDAVHPGVTADAPYDGVDADCDGASDNDADADGFDDAGHGGDDCDDADPAIHPDAYEDCDTVDNDCDDQIDELAPTWYADQDSDGYGDSASGTQACNQPPDTTGTSGDCDDLDDTMYPGAPGIACDGRDNDCDPLTLEAGGALLDGVAAADLPTAVAGATSGSLVEACEGLHAVTNVVIATGIDLVGLAGSASTVLDGGSASRILEVATTEPVSITGFTMRYGTSSEGGALRLGAGSDVVLTDVVIHDNVAGDGAGIWGDDDVRLHLVRSEVRDNLGDPAFTPVPFGGGIYLRSRATLTLEDSIISNNHAGGCGGLHADLAAIVEGIGTAEIASNTTDLAAAGGCLGTGSYASGLLVTGNQTSNAIGGLEVDETHLVDVELVANLAGLSAGALFASGQTLLENVTMENNEAFDGGAIEVVFPDTRVVLDGCTVRNNQATFFAASGGGATLELDAVLESINTNWIGNLPADVALTSGNAYTYGGVASFVCDDALDTCI